MAKFFTPPNLIFSSLQLGPPSIVGHNSMRLYAVCAVISRPKSQFPTPNPQRARTVATIRSDFTSTLPKGNVWLSSTKAATATITTS